MLSTDIATLIREESTIRAEEFFWTDSQVVLAYLNNDIRRFHVLVANRIQKIKDRCSVKDWRHVSSEENPADHASRGLPVKDLLSSNWFTGPQFLWEDNIHDRTSQQQTTELSSSDLEVKKKTTLQTQCQENTNCLVDRLTKFLSWKIAVTAVTALRTVINKKNGQPAEDFVLARENREHLLIRRLQLQHFREELNHLQQKKIVNTSSPIHKLDPSLHTDNLLRVGGRLR